MDIAPPARLGDVTAHREAREFIAALRTAGLADRILTRAPVPASDLTALRTPSATFLTLVDQKTVTGQLASAFVPARVGYPILDTDDALVAHIVPDGHPIPLDRVTISSDVVAPQVLKNLFVFDARTVDSPDPTTARAFERALTALLRRAWDAAFVDALVAASTDLDPGSSIEVADFLTALFAFVSDGAPRAPVLLTSPRAAAWLAGQDSYETVAIDGSGTMAGVRLLTSPRLENKLMLIDAGRIAMADDGLLIESARDATIEMDSAPVGNAATPTGATASVSMYQTNSLSVRVMRYLAWEILEDNAVAHVVISDVPESAGS